MTKVLSPGAAKARELKQSFLDYKGNACIVCKYDKCIGALEFHHVDPSTKNFSIGTFYDEEKLKKVFDELDKCVVLCSNCHKEHHYGLISTEELSVCLISKRQNAELDRREEYRVNYRRSFGTHKPNSDQLVMKELSQYEKN